MASISNFLGAAAGVVVFLAAGAVLLALAGAAMGLVGKAEAELAAAAPVFGGEDAGEEDLDDELLGATGAAPLPGATGAGREGSLPVLGGPAAAGAGAGADPLAGGGRAAPASTGGFIPWRKAMMMVIACLLATLLC